MAISQTLKNMPLVKSTAHLVEPLTETSLTEEVKLVAAVLTGREYEIAWNDVNIFEIEPEAARDQIRISSDRLTGRLQKVGVNEETAVKMARRMEKQLERDFSVGFGPSTHD